MLVRFMLRFLVIFHIQVSKNVIEITFHEFHKKYREVSIMLSFANSF